MENTRSQVTRLLPRCWWLVICDLGCYRLLSTQQKRRDECFSVGRQVSFNLLELGSSRGLSLDLQRDTVSMKERSRRRLHAIDPRRSGCTAARLGVAPVCQSCINRSPTSPREPTHICLASGLGSDRPLPLSLCREPPPSLCLTFLQLQCRSC